MKLSSRLAALALAAAVTLPVSAQAHRGWLFPSATVVSGEDVWVTVDGARSNNLFFPDHQPLRFGGLDRLVITAPDGEPAEAQNVSQGRYRSTFDVPLKQEGTYRIASLREGMFGRYELDGETHRWRGTADTLSEIPEGAENLQLAEVMQRYETFVTLGAPSETALEPTGKGLEMVPVTHPNDLYAGEEARFRLLMAGEPLADAEVEIIPGGDRYRNQLNAMNATTGEDGVFSVTWPEAGMYWLEASASDDKTSVEQASNRRASYAATLEVLPQ